MSLQEELRELVLSDQLPEILRMLAKTFHDRAEEHAKKMRESFHAGQYVWWSYQGFELERAANYFEGEIQNRDLTPREREQKQQDQEIKLKKEELARLMAKAAEPGGH